MHAGSLLVTKEEMVKEDGDFQFCKNIPGAHFCTKSKRQECSWFGQIIL